MKIKVNKINIKETIIDILLAMLLVMYVIVVHDNKCLKEQNEEIKSRYDIVQGEKTELIKILKEPVEQDSIVNNKDARGDYIEEYR